MPDFIQVDVVEGKKNGFLEEETKIKMIDDIAASTLIGPVMPEVPTEK